jgi:hypothetical protein
MDFIINNPNVPQNMFPGQPNNMPMYQNPQYTFNNFETKKVILFYSASSTTGGKGEITTNKIYTSGGSTIMYNASGEPSSASWSSGSFVSASYGESGIFKFTLVEPLQVDKMSDVYLDNITLCNASFNASISPATYGVALKINEIQQKTVSNNQTLNAKELIVINSQPARGSPSDQQPTFYESKNKKYNFLGVIPPGQYKELNGVLCDIEESRIISLSESFAFTIELIISNQK